MSKINSDLVDVLFGERATNVARDLKLNLKRVLSDGALDGQEAALALLATATSVESPELVEFARERAREFDLTHEQITEAEESAAIMAMLNMYYRFRHMVSHNDQSKADDYKQAGLRMTALAKPVMGKERFEMLAFAVSVLNGCESCIVSHEKVLRDAGVSVEKIHDLARLAAVAKAYKTLMKSSE